MNTKSIIHCASLSAFLVAFLAVDASVRAADWVDLFDGKSLNGWGQRGGSAKYRVEDGQIIGTAVDERGESGAG